MNFIDCEGHVIHYRHLRAPAGPCFLMINSLGTDFRIWQQVADRLSSHGSVLCFDKPGHGLSEPVNKPLSIADYAEDICFLLNSLKIDTCVCIGLSMGGLIAQYLALHFPERISHLILCATTPRFEDADFWNQRAAQVRQKGLPAISEKLMQRWLSSTYANDNPAGVVGLKTMLENCSPTGYITACTAMAKEDLTADIHRIRIPTLCVAGDGDTALPVAAVADMSKHIRDAKFEMIRNTGHLIPFESPDRLTHCLLNFIGTAPDFEIETGRAVRRAVLGKEYVAAAENNTTDFDRDFQQFITRTAWGAVWSRPALTKRERSLVTIALLTALSHHHELSLHLDAARNTGATWEDIREVLLHTAIYAGIPAANKAMSMAKTKSKKFYEPD